MRIPLAVCVLTLAASAGAQTPPPAPPTPQDQEGSEAEGKAVQEPGQVRTKPRPATKEEAPAKDEAPGTVHTVVRGDTLWDLSQTYLGSPWYWPKVWSYNPQIANPHWIYPGNQVRFHNGNGEEPAGRVDVEGEPLTESDLSAVEPAEDEGVAMIGLKPYQPKGHEKLPREGFVTDRELDQLGVIYKSFAETQMLTTGDIVYLKFRDPSTAVVGKDYLVYRPERKVYHPRTGRFVGYLTVLLGQARVLQTDDPNYIRARISETTKPMYRGDYVGPPGEAMVLTVAPVANTNSKELEGAVIASMGPYATTISAERAQVIVDLGSADGLVPGNTLTIIRQADPLDQGVDPAANQDVRLPREEIGRCIAAEVKEHASTCMLMRTAREIVAGDRLLLLTPGKAPVSAR